MRKWIVYGWSREREKYVCVGKYQTHINAMRKFIEIANSPDYGRYPYMEYNNVERC